MFPFFPSWKRKVCCFLEIDFLIYFSNTSVLTSVRFPPQKSEGILLAARNLQDVFLDSLCLSKCSDLVCIVRMHSRGFREWRGIRVAFLYCKWWCSKKEKWRQLFKCSHPVVFWFRSFNVTGTATTKNKKIVTRNITINLSTVCDLFMVAFVSNDRPWSSQKRSSSHPAQPLDVHKGVRSSRWSCFRRCIRKLAREVVLKSRWKYHCNSRWWFQIFFIFTPILGEDSRFDWYFSSGLKPPTSHDPWKMSC